MRTISPYLLFLSLILFSCRDRSSASEEIKKQYTSRGVIATPPFAFDYEVQKKKCKELFTQNKNLASPESKTRLTNFIADSLIPCWYGTPWDFNGTTQTPQTGNIACGYFVTTTLRDAGMQIDRVKLAQCASEQLVKSTCTDIQRFSNKSVESFVEAVKRSGYGLYIVGLDNHTGLILNDGKEVYFIHSGVLLPRCALKEKAIESRTLSNSKYRVVGRIVL
ncbi:MAG: hypothetical protein ABL876_07660 [Chitinophagaceae bacterium]